jgi:hypothetical protein
MAKQRRIVCSPHIVDSELQSKDSPGKHTHALACIRA